MISEKFRYVLHCECGTKTKHVLTEAKFKGLSGLLCDHCKTGKTKEFQAIRRYKIQADGEQINLF